MPARKKSTIAAPPLEPRRTSRRSLADAQDVATAAPQTLPAKPKDAKPQPDPPAEPKREVAKPARGKKRKETKEADVKLEGEVEEVEAAGPNKKRKVSNKTLKKAVEEKAAPANPQSGVGEDPEEDGVENVSKEAVLEALQRPPPVNSDYVPLPWKGRLGFACLNTYLRNANPPIFSSRTCRIASILEHRHPLADPSQPEHPTKNRPDKEQPADIERGQRYVEALGVANARDIIKMVRWNDRYGIKFLRLSSEMFPFASHAEYGYKLEPFAADTLAAAGREIAKLGHRVTTHPGQFTQLGSPRNPVIDASIRDLAYHDELLSLLKLPPQQNRDAVMILHMGGVFGDKGETLDRFRTNYAKLTPSIKHRLVLENDDVSWNVHDLLPVCEELNIPMVLDFHHHNILFNPDHIREGTKDIMDLYPRILATWKRKNITPKMHYSESCEGAITPRQRRKHRPRVENLPPCPDTMDLMIEAKDKEQAVFELMRKYKLPGYEAINEIIPHVRQDENKPEPARKKKKKPDDEPEEPKKVIPENEVGMGGPEGRVYWPLGQEEWLRPPKRVVNKKAVDGDEPSKAAKATPKKGVAKAGKAVPVKTEEAVEDEKKPPPKKKAKAKQPTPKKIPEPVLTPSPSVESSEAELSGVGEESAEEFAQKKRAPKLPRRASGRKAARVSYVERDLSE